MLRLSPIEGAEWYGPFEVPEMTNKRPLSVMLVDDNRDGADSLHVVLRLLGYESFVAYSSAAALSAATEMMPDVLISDIGMPNVDGCQLVAKLAALDQVNPLMIALTGYHQHRERCMLAGYDYFFLKPADPAKTVALLVEHAKKLGRAARDYSTSLPRAYAGG